MTKDQLLSAEDGCAESDGNFVDEKVLLARDSDKKMVRDKIGLDRLSRVLQTLWRFAEKCCTYALWSPIR